jgi:hypothetical protein
MLGFAVAKLLTITEAGKSISDPFPFNYVATNKRIESN